MDRGKKRLCVVTSTRADWGLLSPVCRSLRASGLIDIDIVATNMHLSPAYGNTVDEIIADGFEPLRVPVDEEDSGDASRARVMARTLSGMAEAFSILKPDAVLLLGDRYEMLAVASAASVMHIPIIHIAGGEVTEGALDDSFRHAITKLSSLHLTATDDYRRRVIQMGENPDSVINTGAIGVWNAMNIPLMPAAEISESLGFDVTVKPLAIVTYHPATNDATPPVERLRSLLDALDRYPGLRLVITAPNNDSGGHDILEALMRYAQERRGRAVAVRSLGAYRYHSLLRLASFVIGNSSSGIVEVPSAGIPTIDIGMRQRGRIAGPSVIHCGDTADEIAEAIDKALSPGMREIAGRCENPYGKPDTCRFMTEAIEAFMTSLPLPPKTFYDLR